MSTTMVHTMSHEMAMVCKRHMYVQIQNSQHMETELVMMLVKLQIGICGKRGGNSNPATGRQFCLGVKREKWVRIA